jgi:hypothetical protein
MAFVATLLEQWLDLVTEEVVRAHRAAAPEQGEEEGSWGKLHETADDNPPESVFLTGKQRATETWLGRNDAGRRWLRVLTADDERAGAEPLTEWSTTRLFPPERL